jgi:hypothetical protein
VQVVDGTEVAPAPALSEHEVLGALDDLHRRFAAEEIGFDEFEAERDALLAQLAGDS